MDIQILYKILHKYRAKFRRVRSVFENITNKSKKLIITTGNIPLEILNRLKNIKLNKNIIFIDQINFLDLELITSRSDLLIGCHGALSHVAAAYNIKQLDIIEERKFILS